MVTPDKGMNIYGLGSIKSGLRVGEPA